MLISVKWGKLFDQFHRVSFARFGQAVCAIFLAAYFHRLGTCDARCERGDQGSRQRALDRRLCRATDRLELYL